MATNEYGLDVRYFEARLNQITNSVNRYTPEEMFHELNRLSLVAAQQAGLRVSVKVKFMRGANNG